jgi:23S rRNA (uridine2552-2'-O)-methyltransferase
MAFRQTLARLSQKSKSKSASWASRQQRDPFVKMRINDPAAYRARSAYKLLDINDECHHFLDQPDVHGVVDLGAAPGGWSQVVSQKLGWGAPAASRLAQPESEEVRHILEEAEDSDAPKPKKWKKPKKVPRVAQQAPMDDFDPLNIDDVGPYAGGVSTGRGRIVAVDLLRVERIPGVESIKGDFLLDSTTRLVQKLLVAPGNPFGRADVVLSDMAANVSGNDAHDIEQSLRICEAVFEFAQRNLRTAESIGRRRGGVLLVKFFAHPLLDQFRDEKLKPNFNYVQYIKPESSRATSREGYFLCQGWNPG